MSYNFLFLLVISVLFWNIKAENVKGENSMQSATKSNNIRTKREITFVPKFVVQMIQKTVRNIFQNLKDMLQSFEKYVISMLSDSLSFLARSENTTITTTFRRRRSPKPDDSNQSGQNRGGVISMASKLFMAPFKMAFGAVKWLPGAVIDGTTKIGVAVAGDVMHNSVFQSVAHVAVTTAEKVAEESWNFTKVSVLPTLDKWVTSLRESDTLPDSISKFLTEMQTLYHLYRFLGLA